MLYGWIEVGLSNNGLFNQESNEDIIIRTIYDNKIIFGNTDGLDKVAAMYIKGNNVGINKVPNSDISLDVNGPVVLKQAQVGLSNLPTYLRVNGNVQLTDTSLEITDSSNIKLDILNSNEQVNFTYDSIPRITLTKTAGITLNDYVTISSDIYANSFQITSDSNVKRGIIPSDINKDIKILQKLQVKDFMKYNSSNITKGFIAQEVEEIFPQAVSLNYTLRTIDTNQIVAVNTSVLRNLLERVEVLESKLKRYEA